MASGFTTDARIGLLSPSILLLRRLDRQGEVQAKGVAVNGAQAYRHAGNILPIVREIQATGVSTLKDIMAVLNARGVRTAWGAGMA